MGFGQYSNQSTGTPQHTLRSRTVFSSNELPHLWAHQTQQQGRYSASMSFAGPDFYSYSIVIGAIVKAKDGRTVYLIGDGHYSVTTSRHQGMMRYAIPTDALRITIPSPDTYDNYAFSDATRIMNSWRKYITRNLEEAGQARQPKKGRLLSEASAIVDQMRSYAKLMGVKTGRLPRIPATVDELNTYTANKDKRDATQKKTALKAAAKATEKRKEELALEFAAWLKGAVTLNGRHIDVWKLRDFPTALRIVDNEIETSQGVYFPIVHAIRGLTLVRAVMARGEEWKTNGHTCHLGQMVKHLFAKRNTPFLALTHNSASDASNR